MLFRSLKDLKFLLVEDTRRTSKLLNEYNAFPKMIVYNDINKQKVIPKIIDIIFDGGEKIKIAIDTALKA